MPLKVTWFFEGAGEGWTEVYYTSQANIADYLGATDQVSGTGTEAAKFANRRSEILGTAYTVRRVRVNDLATPGAFRVGEVLNPDDYKRFSAEASSAEVFASLLINMEAGPTHRRRLYLGGIPEAVVQQPGNYVPPPTFVNAFKRFADYMTGGIYTTRSRPRIDPASTLQITAFDVQPDARTSFMSPRTIPLGDPASWYVLIRGLRNPRGWNGVHRAIKGPTADTMLIGPTRKTLPSTPVFIPDPAATVAVFAVTYNVIDRVTPIRVISRRRGRPFGLPRGRR